MKAIGGVLSIFITMPIWFFLLYRILQFVQATELMWFLYWAYVPISVLAAIILKIAEDAEK
jgi:hypothetical protein